MSRRNVYCTECGEKGRADVIGGPQCAPDVILPRCRRCGAKTALDTTPPKNRKPDVAPDGRRRRHGTRGGKPGRAP